MRERSLSLVSFAVVSAILLGALCSPVSAGYRDDLIADLGQLEEKLVGLAKAIPEDEYGWRPSEEVRSVSEALMHVAGGNFFFPTLRGMTPPEGVEMQSLEQITDKEKVIATLEQSFDHARKAAEAVSEDELGETVSMFGNEVTVAGYLHALASHNHEHLGQMIAYARSLGVTPPWSGGGDGN